MSALTTRHAAARVRVRLPTGRLGTLIYVPSSTRARRNRGLNAVVLLDSGAHVSYPPGTLTLAITSVGAPSRPPV